tara:strand:+ start:250 stop:1854 length:1605 start_codon:yes stop_codon:yes gene_type:complete
MARSQPFTVACEGGLVTASNQIDLLRRPGVATELENFEVSIEGGYRRISGFKKFGDSNATQPTGGVTTIQGVFPYADGVIVTAGTNIYFSNDGISWIEINKLSAGVGDNYSTFTGKSVTARTGQGQCQFVLFEGATFNYGEVIIADGANKLWSFRMEGTGALNTRTFFTQEITVDGTNGIRYITIHDHHLIAAGVENNLNTVFYSVYNDPDNFTGSGAGSVQISDQIQGVKGFRTDLIVFAENSIHKLININDSNSIRIDPITENVGCLSGYSIQEIAGDLLFLAPDGIRTVAGTARIGDVELGTISKSIQPILTLLAQSVSSYRITSAVIREKSQYRLFYSNINAVAAGQKGIIGTLRQNGFEWSETKGLEVTEIGSGFDKDGIEAYYHGNNTGYIHIHDSGVDFDGTAILARYSTPNYDYGDLGTLKTLHYLKVSAGSEGLATPEVKISFDYGSGDVPQPADNFSIGTINPPSFFGRAVFGTNIFGATADPMIRIPLQGSGTSNNFTFISNDSKPSYKINGLYVDYIPSGRR